ncbi:hypothetical protein [Microcystis aeruginosa]|uniref:hypothetical protein n=1 Tax=Microcystis aeruginosa TaxID=1126 RepID=UPI00092FF0E1|nr:hypothetical protein [Microcystis aeruginosa]
MLIVFDIERTNQLSLLPDKDLVDLCPPIEPYQVTKNQKFSLSPITSLLIRYIVILRGQLTIDYTETFRITRVRIWGNFRHITPFCGLLTIS